ncbi:copper chaperone PCu(A)C [Orientia tsutsugamushi]|uniref:Copper chaperone PCu(A)C n=1 Tax=Orientia tsutsugamushi TaxID=784 RepID=A0A2U3RNJ8_ORITS|nr:copper chaperone PCu(A)C [Orientia tsutsugamushi]KJV54587.1 hypothetical protein OTSKARP_1048 [Orientia tsutsugamushi str. Karp]SPR14811.1 Uncharacterised protein [Orientia tsutsugamushi]
MRKSTLILLTLSNIFTWQVCATELQLEPKEVSSSCCLVHHNSQHSDQDNALLSNNNEFSNAEVQFLNAWARPADKGKNTAVYLTINNQSLSNLEIIGVSAPNIANAAMFHQSIRDNNGVISMSHIEHLLIPLQTTFKLKPGGFHIMLTGVTKQLTVGDSFDLTFCMKDQSTKTIKVQVKK